MQQERKHEVPPEIRRVRDDGPPMGTNGWSRWAAICGVVALVPLGLGFGLTGLVQTTRSGQRGRGLAVLGIAASVVWSSLLYSMFTIPGLSVDRNANGNVDKAQYASVFDVHTGDCFTWAAPRPDDSVQMVQLVPCAQTHDAQVYDTPTLPLTGAEPEAAAKDACAASPAAPAGAELGLMYPQYTSFGKDSRRVICYTTSP
ncbi:DUF4190 domain-containing protein [Streptacidiphilus sp. PAMC 29251]